MANTNLIVRALGTAGIALMALAGPALAEDRQFGWSVTLGATSDYVFRGISLNGEKPAAQGSIDATYGILYAGVWGSNITGDFGPAEVDIYAGIKPVLGPITFDFGVIYYYYPGQNEQPGIELDYTEFKAGASASPIKNLSVGVVGYYSDDQSDGGEEYAVEGSAAYTLPNCGIFTPTIGGVFGWQGFENAGFALDDDEYLYWNVGLALAVEKFTFDFRYWDTDIDENDSITHGLSDERFVFSAKVTLP